MKFFPEKELKTEVKKGDLKGEVNFTVGGGRHPFSEGNTTERNEDGRNPSLKNFYYFSMNH